MSNDAGTLSILIDIRAQLQELTRAHNETARLTDQTRRAGEEANKLGHAFKLGIGIDLARRGIGLLTNSLRQSVSEAFRLAEATKAAADNLQVDVRSYQVLSDMVKSAHGDVSALAGALNNQRASMVQARDTTSSAASAVRVLGLDFARIQSMRPERQFEAIAKAIRGATDQEAAFAAASELLGERNVRNLRHALTELAEQGFDKVKASAEGAAKFMTPQAIAQLNAVKKMFGDNWDKFVAKVGNDMASLSAVFFGQAEVPKPEEKTGDQLRAAANLLTQQKALVDAQQRLTANARSMGVVAGNPMLSEDAKRTSALAHLTEQRAALNEILALRGENAEWLAREIGSLEKATFNMRWQAALGGEMTDHYQTLVTRLERLKDIQKAGTMPLAIENKETDQKRVEEVGKLRVEIAGLDNELNTLLGKGQKSAMGDLRERFGKFQNPSNPTQAFGRDPRLSSSEGAEAGAMQWVMSLGTQGEQIAGAMQSTIGVAVSNISDGIYGWITGAHSFGEAMRNLAANALRIVLDRNAVQLPRRVRSRLPRPRRPALAKDPRSR